MVKKLLILIIGLLISLAFSQETFASPSIGEVPSSASVSIAKQDIEFSDTPFILNDEIMVPANQFFEKLGTQVWWFEDTSEIVTYQDNIFMKFKANSKIAYINGKPKEMAVHAIFFKNELYLPASFIAEFYGMNYEIDHISNKLSIDYRENLLEYRQFGYQHFKRVNLAKWGFNFYMPEYWETVPDEINSYGVDNSFETYKLTAEYFPQKNVISRNSFKNSIVKELTNQHGSHLEITSQNTQKLGEYASDIITYDIKEPAGLQHYVKYIFYEGTSGYVLTGFYPNSNNIEESIEIYNLVAQTFSITKLSINESLEHYTELPYFFDYGVQLKNTIHSNMPVKNQFELSGSLKNNGDIKGFHVTVSKDSNKTSYYIPVKNNEFNSKIYTPFGLGKHNVKVIIDSASSRNRSQNLLEIPTASLDDYVLDAQRFDFDEDSPDMILKFSVLNTSNEPIKNILQSVYINYDFPEVFEITNSTTFNLTNQYSKARVLYEWIIKNYTYREGLYGTELRDVRQLTEVRDGNSIELCFLYTGLLRSANIPARIMRGNTGKDVLYWVETYLNGTWTIASISEDVHSDLKTVNYFYLDRLTHYNRFDRVDALDF